ncbi:hypothetical protein GOBAR_DD34596 [Gossypium barbadense]|nr:hypothetical protein GOBAR_DD34596 [Gossypium barbadense]
MGPNVGLKVENPLPNNFKLRKTDNDLITVVFEHESKKEFGDQANLSQSKDDDEDDEVKMLVGNEVHAREGNVRETKYQDWKIFCTLKMEGASEVDIQNDASEKALMQSDGKEPDRIAGANVSDKIGDRTSIYYLLCFMLYGGSPFRLTNVSPLSMHRWSFDG